VCVRVCVCVCACVCVCVLRRARGRAAPARGTHTTHVARRAPPHTTLTRTEGLGVFVEQRLLRAQQPRDVPAPNVVLPLILLSR
jgi:hypothetical protein